MIRHHNRKPRPHKGLKFEEKICWKKIKRIANNKNKIKGGGKGWRFIKCGEDKYMGIVSMGLWVYGLMGLWAYGHNGILAPKLH